MSPQKSASSLTPARPSSAVKPRPSVPGLGLRRVNAWISLITVLALCYHSLTMGWSMWTGWYNRDVAVSSAWIIAGCVVVHVFLVLVLFFFFAEGGALTYKKDPRSILIQRVSAIAIIILLHFHIEAFGAVATGEKLDLLMFLFYVATELAFFGFVMMHVAVSLGQGLMLVHMVSNPDTLKVIDKVCYWACGILFALYVDGMIHFYLGALVL